MPGFIVNNLGGRREGASSSSQYYYTYTWYIENIFGENGRDSVLINAKEMTLPTFSVSKENVMGASLEYKYAKSITYDDVKIVWYDTIGLIKYIIDWRNSVWTEEGGINGAGVYKKNTFQTQYLPNNDDEYNVSYWLKGSWPSVIRHGDLTYTNSDVKIIEVTITYDWAEISEFSDREVRGDGGFSPVITGQEQPQTTAPIPSTSPPPPPVTTRPVISSNNLSSDNRGIPAQRQEIDFGASP